jgi:hypothetical protein
MLTGTAPACASTAPVAAYREPNATDRMLSELRPNFSFTRSSVASTGAAKANHATRGSCFAFPSTAHPLFGSLSIAFAMVKSGCS